MLQIANPARIIPAWRDFVGGHEMTRRRARGIGEPIWAGRDPTRTADLVQLRSFPNGAVVRLHVYLP